ncbi:PRP38 family-domain-containing protein [Mycotypha africana]|uniref:PRP38 family-domain-containing protein n=1 Tax=Mycotypha africana TaxID=64632 RepID=UPI0022FFC74E|nr:PRP38 family-domain-containing protein [Mycotypha africana]KAI8971704.1 PRP38 family-domain-containing protein [Mycotypha africana]
MSANKKASKKASNTLETWGNETTMNLNAIIYQNILSSPYFRSLYSKKTFHEVVDEIYNEVHVLTPFIKGNQPSTAYCCLFKLWTLRLTIKQIENMVDHEDSPYIRAIGFLYLRYVCAPAQLWDWFQYYLEEDEEITITSGLHPQKVTIGKFIRMLITEQKFQGTMLPRIPIPIARDLEKKLQEYDIEQRRAKARGGRGYDDDYYDEKDDNYRRQPRASPPPARYSRSRSRSRSPSRHDFIRRDSRSRSRSTSRHRSYRRRSSRSRSPRSSRDRRDRRGNMSDELDDYYEASRRGNSSRRRDRYDDDPKRSRSRSTSRRR